MNKLFIVALFGCAGVGKDSLQKEIAKQSPSLFHEIISSTTRPPREYEKEGVDYHFISDEESKHLYASHQYLEFAEFRGWRYGTLASSLKPNCFNIGVFNISGVKQLLQLPKDKYFTIPIFIVASQKTRLLRQLNREEHPDCDEIVRRYLADQEDLAPENLNFWHLTELNEYDTLENIAAKTIKDIYEYELTYFFAQDAIRAESCNLT